MDSGCVCMYCATPPQSTNPAQRVRLPLVLHAQSRHTTGCFVLFRGGYCQLLCAEKDEAENEVRRIFSRMEDLVRALIPSNDAIVTMKMSVLGTTVHVPIVDVPARILKSAGMRYLGKDAKEFIPCRHKVTPLKIGEFIRLANKERMLKANRQKRRVDTCDVREHGDCESEDAVDDEGPNIVFDSDSAQGFFRRRNRHKTMHLEPDLVQVLRIDMPEPDSRYLVRACLVLSSVASARPHQWSSLVFLVCFLPFHRFRLSRASGEQATGLSSYRIIHLYSCA